MAEVLNIVLTYIEVADDKFLGSSLFVAQSVRPFLVTFEIREVLAVDVRAQGRSILQSCSTKQIASLDSPLLGLSV